MKEIRNKLAQNNVVLGKADKGSIITLKNSFLKTIALNLHPTRKYQNKIKL